MHSNGLTSIVCACFCAFKTGAITPNAATKPNSNTKLKGKAMTNTNWEKLIEEHEVA